jgi:hypothetical protein
MTNEKDTENEEHTELTKLRAFFKEVAELTSNHDVLQDNAVVYPSKLGDALERVDPEWFRPVPLPNPLAVLASFVHEVLMGVYEQRVGKMLDDARQALERAGLSRLDDVVALSTQPTALERYNANDSISKESPLERLRYFCSHAMNGQDWLDAGPFFDALEHTKEQEEPALPQERTLGFATLISTASGLRRYPIMGYTKEDLLAYADSFKAAPQPLTPDQRAPIINAVEYRLQRFIKGWQIDIASFAADVRKLYAGPGDTVKVEEPKEKPDLIWTGADGQQHWFQFDAAVQDFKRLYDQWPGGLEEIESCMRTLNAGEKPQHQPKARESYWNHRVVRVADGDGETSSLMVCEVYYRDGKPFLRTDDGARVLGHDIEELRETLRRFERALEQPVLDDSIFEETGELK